MNLNNYECTSSIIVTGATSIVGIPLIKKALTSKCIVYAIIRKNSKNKEKLPQHPNLKIIEGDLNNLKDIGVEGIVADYFYHLGWEGTTPADRTNWEIQQNNIMNSIDAVHLANKTKCRTFIFAGSQAEYGSQNQTISIDTREKPESAYGVSKYIAGESTKIMCTLFNITHVWTKIFSVFGPNDKSKTLINEMIGKFSKDLPMTFSSGKQNWEYIYEDDVGEILYRLGAYINSTCKFIISTGDSKPLKWYIETTKEMMNSKSKCNYSMETPHGISSNPSNQWHQINYHPEVSFSEGIRKILDVKSHNS